MKKVILATALGVTTMIGFVGEASAGRQEYCDSYARDVANHETHGGADVLVGTIGGALGGALIGGLIDNGRGAGRGAIIGGVGGTVLGAGATSDRYNRAYGYAYDRCMDRSYSDSGRSWNKACARKYPTFNPQTGKYRTASGSWKPCRL
jgi:hypothetical protein